MIIPERQTLYEALKSNKSALRLDEIATLFTLDDGQTQAAQRRLDAMVRDGQVVRDTHGAYSAGREAQRSVGTFIASDRSMSVELEAPAGAYIELPHRLVRGLVDGDRVAVHSIQSLAGSTGSKDGEPLPVAVEILSRDREVAGRVTDAGFIETLHEVGPYEVHCVAGKKANVTAKSGDVVIVRLNQPASRGEAVSGEIVEVLGDRGEAGMEVDIVLRTYDIPSRWRREALAEADSRTPVAETDIAGREDLRDMSFVTIDGEDAKDFDDAILFERNGDGWRLWVAIADVASYVLPNSALDDAAYQRGNSVYFPGRVVPMLPAVLSNGLCSLRPDEDRLALVCRIDLSAQGEVADYQFMRAVIRSQARLTYTEVGRFLRDGKGLNDRPTPVRSMLRVGLSAFKQLLVQRQARGALELDMVETRLMFDEQGTVRKIVPFERNDAHRLIEECMICANVCAAKFLAERERGLVYRVHSGLKEGTAEDLKFFLRERGLTLHGESSHELSTLIEEVVGRDDAHAVQSVILRSLTRALYHPDNIGHYGLALGHYTHFTSPIRRYPDLLVHRAIHAVLGEKGAGRHYNDEELRVIGEHCSITEKRADDATRDVGKYLRCLYIKDRVGEEFTGIVVGVTSFGLFLELDEVYVEGLLHIASLDSDYYFFDSRGHRLVGESSGKVYRLGDRLDVVLSSVVPEERKVDFLLRGHGSKKSSRPRRPRRPRRPH